MDTEVLNNIKCLINLCLLPKLARNYEESEKHPEIAIRNNTLEKNVNNLEKALASLDLNNDKATIIIANLHILFLELNSSNVWNTQRCKKASEKMNTIFIQFYNVSLQSILCKESIWNIQDIFNACIEDIHMKLNYEDFKKYPAQIDVYNTIIKDIKKYPITIRPSQVMPLCLLLMDDYVDTNKQKGLESCLHILQCLEPHNFEGGNYYEVIYVTLKKLLYEKGIEITKLTHACLLELCKVFPSEEKDKKLDELYSMAIEQLSLESNLKRKSEYLKLINSLITLHKTNCINRSAIKTALCECLDVCTENAVAEILLDITLQCLTKWLKYCWCVWRYSKDHKMMSILLKLLYTCKNDEATRNIQNILKTLYSLCSNCEQEQILGVIQQHFNTLPDDYCKKLIEINENFKKYIVYLISIFIYKKIFITFNILTV